MTVGYKVNWDASGGVFAAPDGVVEYIKLANGKAAKVIIYLLGNKLSKSVAETAEALGIGTDDVEDALSYWEQVGVIGRTERSRPEPQVSETVSPAAAPPREKHTAADEKARPSETHEENATKMISPKEIAERANSSKDIKFLFDSAQEALAKPLTYTEQRTLIWIHDYHGLGADLIMMIIEFCKSINKTGISYVEKIALNWTEKNIVTHEQAENEIHIMQNYWSLEGQIKSKLEMNRVFTPKERALIKNWANMGAGIDLILFAYEKAADATGKISFAYMDKVLSGWADSGVKTVAQAKDLSKRYAGSAKQSSKKAGEPKEHSFNIDLLLEYAKNNVPRIKEESDVEI